ncbi:phage portal protein [Azospirillum sp. TSO5]|uniref:phage portal protein n=1 Tax=Azospirillum sp. TSO5 TaxID=716760 RepID=UPI000D6447C2|nr:phage portal protein [Azospirillum sp. TSO5]
MARPEGTPIEPGFLSRVAQGFKYALRGGTAMDWFGPSQPLQPAAPEEVKGRAWDFPTGTNLQTRPRGTEGVSFEQLRALADAYDLLRLAIETRKDQLCRVPWSIQPQQRPDQQMRDKPDQRCADLEAFLKFPDRRRPWARWLRTLAEDLFVLDAPSLYIRRSMAGDVFSLDVIDGATIRPLVGADGRSPLPPEPCYQQVLKGVPAVDYTADELIYLPFNPRSNRVYGYGQVEQVIRTVEIGIRRQIHQMQHYTEGNVPEALCGVPEEWSPDQIDQFQRYWDSLMEGNTAARRHMKFVPGKLAIQFTKDVALKDMFDEWLARVICYAFSLPPTAFVQQMNRATAQTAQEAALEEGLAPLMQWVKELLDLIIQKHFGYTDLEFVWKNEKELDPAVKNQLEIEKLKVGLLSFDEIRQADGKAPYGIGPIIFGVGPAGFIMVEDLKDPAKRAALMNPQPPALPGAAGEPPPGHPGAPPSPAPAPGPAISEAHHAAAAALHATVSSAPAPRPVAVETEPLNEAHQAAIDHIHEIFGVTPQQQAQDDGAHTPEIAEAMAALQETLGKRAGPFDDALAKASPPYLLRIAEAAESGLVQAFGNALLWWNRQGERIGEDAAIASSPDDIALPIDEMERRLDPAFGKLRSVFREAGEATVNDNLPAPPGSERIDFNFDLRNRRVTDFLDGYKMDLIRHITADQTEQVRAIVTDAATRGEPPATIARRVRDVVGLTPYQAGVVETYRAELERLAPAALSRVLRDAHFDPTLNRALESGQALGDEQIDKMVAAYKRRFLDMRAMTIGRTESIRAANHGARMSVAAMLDDPEMEGLTVEKTWMATDDHRTRDSHRAMNGQKVVGLDTPFVTPSGVQMSGPHDPAAPAEEVINCRCTCKFRLVPAAGAAF